MSLRNARASPPSKAEGLAFRALTNTSVGVDVVNADPMAVDGVNTGVSHSLRLKQANLHQMALSGRRPCT